MKAQEIRTVFMGTPDFALDTLRGLLDAGLDLVEVSPNAKPPVCKVMDFGKFAYEKTRKEREARKHQKQIEIKTIKSIMAYKKK